MLDNIIYSIYAVRCKIIMFIKECLHYFSKLKKSQFQFLHINLTDLRKSTKNAKNIVLHGKLCTNYLQI